MAQKIYDLYLPYYKKGDDLNRCMEAAEKMLELGEIKSEDYDSCALELYAKNLEIAASILRKMAAHAKAGKLTIEAADTHLITLKMAEELGGRLIDEGLFSSYFDDDDGGEPYDDEDEDDDDEDEDEDEDEDGTLDDNV